MHMHAHVNIFVVIFAASDPKDDSLCIVPECANLKYKDPNSGKEHDFCGRTHAEEARRRNIKRR